MDGDVATLLTCKGISGNDNKKLIVEYFPKLRESSDLLNSKIGERDFGIWLCENRLRGLKNSGFGEIWDRIGIETQVQCLLLISHIFLRFCHVWKFYFIFSLMVNGGLFNVKVRFLNLKDRFGLFCYLKG